MIQKHEERAARGRQAGRPGHPASRSSSTGRTSARSRTRSTTATPSSSPTARRRSGCRTSPRQTGMVIVVPMYEEDEQASGHLLQHRRGHRRRRDVSRQVPQDPHPARQGLLGEVLLPARQPGLPGLRDGRRQGRRLHLLRPPLPRGRPGARAQRRRDRLHPVGDLARPVRVPVADRAAEPRRRQRLLRRDDQPGRHRDRLRRRRLLRPELLRRPARPVRRRRRRSPTTRS